MRRESLAQRYIGTTRYAGLLLTEDGLDWLVHKAQPQGLAYPCFLPECRRLVMRNGAGQTAFFCSRTHRKRAQSRLQAINETIEWMSTELATIPLRPDGRPATRRGRQLEPDLKFLNRHRHLYEGLLGGTDGDPSGAEPDSDTA